jgi:hypothetical protein
MMMNRRTFSAAMVAGAAASLISTRGRAANPVPPKARNVVLVHPLLSSIHFFSSTRRRSKDM